MFIESDCSSCLDHYISVCHIVPHLLLDLRSRCISHRFKCILLKPHYGVAEAVGLWEQYITVQNPERFYHWETFWCLAGESWHSVRPKIPSGIWSFSIGFARSLMRNLYVKINACICSSKAWHGQHQLKTTKFNLSHNSGFAGQR